MNISVMVIGGQGFIGKEVIGRLSREAIPVISVDKCEYNFSSNNVKNICNLDLLKPRVLKKIFRENDISSVIHLVGLPVISECEKNSELSFQLNTESVQRLVEGVKESNAKKIIFASTASVYGYSTQNPVTESTQPKPDTVYGRHKLMAEQIIREAGHEYGFDTIIFRMFNVFGRDPLKGDDVISIFIRKALKGEPILVKGGSTFRDFIYVKDVAEAFTSACFKNSVNATINIGSGIKTTIKKVADIVKSCFPNVEIMEESIPDGGKGIYADISLARKLLDFKPRDSEKNILEYIAKYTGREIR